MNTSLTTAIAAVCLLTAVGLGMWPRRLLPATHLSPDSRDTVKLALGLVATISAVLLGLLLNSAKTSYESTRVQVMEVASKFALLDRVLAIYGRVVFVRRHRRQLGVRIGQARACGRSRRSDISSGVADDAAPNP